MGDEIYSDGHDSAFNEASLRMQRINEEQRKLSHLLTNLLAYNPDYLKRNYDVAFTLIQNLLRMAYGKMNTKEKENYTKYRKDVTETTDFYPIYKIVKSDGMGGNKTFQSFSKSNYDKARDLIFKGVDFIEDVYERVGYGAPNVEVEEGYD